MSRKKKLIAASVAMILTGTLFAFNGIMAYLTDAETTTNTFSVGDVQIDLVEPNWPGNETVGSSDVIPNQPVSKDPHVVNTGSNDAIVYVKVSVPKKEVVIANPDGTKTAAAKQEVIQFVKGGTLNQSTGVLTGGTYVDLSSIQNASTDSSTVTPLNDGWMLLSINRAGDNTNEYVFGYIHKLVPEKAADQHLDNDVYHTSDNPTGSVANSYTTNLFDHIALKNIIDGQYDAGDLVDLNVTAYAIQANYIKKDNNGVITDITTGAADPLTYSILDYAYDAYLNQHSGETSVPDARTSDDEDGDLPHNKYGIPNNIVTEQPTGTKTILVDTYSANGGSWGDEGTSVKVYAYYNDKDQPLGKKIMIYNSQSTWVTSVIEPKTETPTKQGSTFVQWTKGTPSTSTADGVTTTETTYTATWN